MAKTEQKPAEAKEAEVVKDEAATSAPTAEDQAESENQVASEDEATKTEQKPAEAKVFYVEGYGNVGGVKTQAEAEKKAAKIQKELRG